ncbi:MAG: SGNH/GDSL hydrolase family protein [Thermoguttaceae bacterium]
MATHLREKLTTVSLRTKKLGLMLASFILALLVAEAGLRIECYLRLEELHETEFSASERESLAIRSDVPGLAFVFRPNMTWKRAPHPSTTNSQGYFDDDHALKKPDGVFRIVVIGDSVAEGLAVGWRRSFVRGLQRRLNAAPAKTTYEVVSLARCGYATSQQLVILRNEALQYNPDLILWSYVLNDPENPFYHGDFIGTIVIRRPSLHLLHRADRAWFFTKENIAARSGPEEYHRKLHHVYWGRIEDHVKQIGHISKTGSVPIVFMVHPWFQAEPSIEEYRSSALHQKLTDLASQNGLLALDLLSAYRGHIPSQVCLPNDPCHLNVEGHNLTAEFLFDELVARRLVAPVE